MQQSRQLAVIMFTDVVGYIALMGSDEHKAMEILNKNRQIHERLIQMYGIDCSRRSVLEKRQRCFIIALIYRISTLFKIPFESRVSWLVDLCDLFFHQIQIMDYGIGLVVETENRDIEPIEFGNIRFVSQSSTRNIRSR